MTAQLAYKALTEFELYNRRPLADELESMIAERERLAHHPHRDDPGRGRLKMTDFTPAEYFDPREYLSDELKARGLTIENMIGTVRRWYFSTEPMTPRFVAYK